MACPRPESTRCTAYRKRRNWLLKHALNPVEVALSALLDGVEAHDAEHDVGEREDLKGMISTMPARPRTSAKPSPCSTTCPHSAIPDCAGSAEDATARADNADGMTLLFESKVS